MKKFWIKKLGHSSDPVRKQMLRLLSQEERKQRRKAARALNDFDRKSWRRWSHKLSAKARLFPLESIVYQRVALGRLNEAATLYQKARKTRSSIAWHRLRIGLKHFRYIVGNFLPQRYDIWEGDLKKMQDLLGEVHDLDSLWTEIRRQSLAVSYAGKTQWFKKIRTERKTRLDEFLRKASSKDSPWLSWRAGLQ